MTELEQAAIDYVSADDAYAEACERYKAFTGRNDLEETTDEEKSWWAEHVAPAMQAVWPLREQFRALARDRIVAARFAQDGVRP